MSSQRANGKRSGKLQELKDRREQAEKKRVRDLASKPAIKPATSIAEKPGNQSLNPSPAKPISLSSLPRIRKVKGTSKAEKKAQEEAVAAAKKKREMAEKEEGEIYSDDDEGMLTGHINDNSQTQRDTPSNKTTKAKPAARTTRCLPYKTKNQMESGNNNNNGARDVKKSQPEALKPSKTLQNLQKPKEPGVKTSSAKHRLFDSDGSSSSEEEIYKPIKKQNTTKAGMDFENPPIKRKHVEGKKEAPPVPVKKQKITEEVKKSVKKPVTAPVKRTPVVKETKYRMDTSKNLFQFGVPQHSKKLAPKKGSMQLGDVSEKLKDLGKRDKKTTPSSNPSTGVSSEIQSLSAASTAKSDKIATAPQSASVKKVQGTEGIMKEELKQEKLQVPKQPNSVVEVTQSLAVELDPEQDALLEKDMDEYMANLDPKVAAAVKAQQQQVNRRFSRESKKQAVKSDKKSVENSGFEIFGDAQETIILQPSPSSMEDSGFEELEMDLEQAFEADKQLQLAIKASFAFQNSNVPSSNQQSVDPTDESSTKDGSTEKEDLAAQQEDLDITSPSTSTTASTITNTTAATSASSLSGQDTTSLLVIKTIGGLIPDYGFARDRGYEPDMADEDGDADFITAKHATPNPSPALPPHLEGGSLEEQELGLKLELELERQLEQELELGTRAAEATAQEENMAQAPSSSDTSPSLDAIATQQKILPVQTPEQDHSNEGLLENISKPCEDSTGSTNDGFDNHSEYEMKDNGASSMETSFEELIDSAASVEQLSPPSPVEENIPEPYVTAKNQPAAEISRAEESRANIEPYVGPDGFIGLPPLDDTTDSDVSDNEDIETFQGSPPEVIILDDTPETKVSEDEDITMMDAYDEEIYRRHRVPPELSNVVVEEGSIDFEKLRAETIAARNELDILQEEAQFEIVVSFDRADLLRDLGVSEERIASYMEVNRGYEPHTGPWPAARAKNEIEIDSSDDEPSDDEEYYEGDDKVKHFQGFQYRRFQSEPLNIPLTDPNAHPFGPS
ncbi:2e969ac2-fa70-472f-bcbc-898e8c9e1bca [Sclerotinia trifoliorum]|uniref:2e969ac2-fa70-472f-bcbc-898e8c9e1bca n=1 Tax=Sclerotinia trifoliorum TaxID=28548 RepID=A0A8H2ZLE1_9HELO|nr:2e969ac2-fa70-472f-bcbc-898e8c9e1bca [Sclerotinia trifoliorum]